VAEAALALSVAAVLGCGASWWYTLRWRRAWRRAAAEVARLRAERPHG
jgi:hypothetical protein